MKRISTFFVLLSFVASFYSTRAEEEPKTPLLERTISINLEQETLASALKKIGQQAGCTFSYNPDALEASKVITYQFTNKTVREVLDQLFKGSIQYKERKRYIILTRVKITSKETREVSGYVVDEATGERLKNVSVYDPVSLSSAVTNAYGYFQMEIPKPSNDELRLAIQKQHYTDTVVAVSTGNGLMRVPMKINTDKLEAFKDSVGSKLKRFWLLTKRATSQAVNMENIDDTLYRNFQFSIVPFVGTNHKLSGNIVNNYSLNLLGGYSLGTRKVEVGGLFNAVRGDVEGVQIAGLVNGVAGRTEAIQLAGLINANRQHIRGVQTAGLINFNWDTSETVALAGLFNFMYQDTRGVKGAGLGNISLKEQKGPHIAGLFNFSIGRTETQVGGIFNFTAGQMTGAQVAGIFNFAGKEIVGAQVAGIFNAAPKRITGVQVGLLNYATRIKGVQVGMLNIADSISGIPVGLLSFVSRGGYHKIEISADEIFYTNIAFRTGVHKFYNIFTAGAQPSTFKGDETIWTFGYGVGTAPRLTRKLHLNADITSNQIVAGNSIEKINLLNKLYLGAEFQVARKLSLTAGATLNIYVTDSTYDQYPDIFRDYQPEIIDEHTYSNGNNAKMWIGGKIGIRFL